MAQTFDLIVVGGGPAGLEAARTAARFGLRVALVERKNHPVLLMRSCAQMFLMNMDNNNFSVPYRGAYREFFVCHFVAPNARDRIEIGDYERLMQGLSPHMRRIEQERPDLARKISRFRPDLALQLIKPAARSGFPNR